MPKFAYERQQYTGGCGVSIPPPCLFSACTRVGALGYHQARNYSRIGLLRVITPGGQKRLSRAADSLPRTYIARDEVLYR